MGRIHINVRARAAPDAGRTKGISSLVSLYLTGWDEPLKPPNGAPRRVR